MAFHGVDELKRLVAGPESPLVERKRSAADRSGIHRYICAFANDLAGTGLPGVIVVGMEDDGRVAGITIDDELLRHLAQMRSDGNIIPIPAMTVDQVALADGEVAVVQVLPADAPPVRYQGRVWVKVGPTVQPATPGEERVLAERRRATDLPYDLQPAEGATIGDLDGDYLRQVFLPAAIAPEVLAENGRAFDQQIRSLRLLYDERPTRGGLIVAGDDPQKWTPGAYVQFLRIDGAETTDPIRDQKVLTGRLEDVLRRLDELLEINVSVRTDVAAAARELRRPDYPLVALQQLARNALMHRSYDGTNAPVRVTWYADRVEIQNPGGLYGQVTRENFGQGVTDYRNPLVAECMHHLGFAQRFGLGIPLARKALADNGNPAPEHDFAGDQVLVTLRPAP